MFGFFAPAKKSRKYRQVYAAYCSHQRQTYGTASSIFTSYEAVFLYLLALDSEVCSELSQATPTCCRMRNDWANHWNIDRELADFCSAFAMLLARTKIEDDKRDSKGLSAILAGRVLRSAFATSEHYFESRFPGLNGKIEQCVGEHVELERMGFIGESTDDLRQYAQPTANAFGTVFEAFGSICKSQSPTVDPLKFRRIGKLVGATIIVADCMFDFERDTKRGEFTPLRSRSDLRKAQNLAMSIASELGFEVSEIVEADTSLSCPVVMHAFERIGAFKTEAAKNREIHKTVKPFAIMPKRLSLLSNRAGDCGGGECCGALCEGACGACGGAGDCGGGDCGCDPSGGCHACGDCCVGGGGKKGKEDQNLADLNDPLIGQVAEAITPLKPTGFIRLENRKIPAQVETGSADAGEKVVIVRKGNFGYIVSSQSESR